MYLYEEVEKILIGNKPENKARVQLMLEDEENPIRGRTVDKLYSSIETMGHIDFGSIEKSRGNITAYDGYESMKTTLGLLKSLGKEGSIKTSIEFNSQVDAVENAISTIMLCGSRFTAAYSKGVKPLILEYNTLVACCVEATTSLLYNFADFMRKPGMDTMEAVLVNQNNRGSLFYIEQLKLFNRTPVARYREYLDGILKGGRENFLVDGALAVGTVAVVTTIALSIVPIIRKCIYTFQDIRRRLTDCLELQAYYLELNRTILEARSDLSKDKKEAILKKQEALRLKFIRLADKIRVRSTRLEQLSAKNLEEDNRRLTIDSTQSDIDNSDIVLF